MSNAYYLKTVLYLYPADAPSLSVSLQTSYGFNHHLHRSLYLLNAAYPGSFNR